MLELISQAGMGIGRKKGGKRAGVEGWGRGRGWGKEHLH